MDFTNRANAEAALAAVLAKLQAEQRREIVRLLGDPPRLDNVPPALWQQLEQEIRRRTASQLLMVYLLYLDQFDKAGVMPIDVGRLPLQLLANESAGHFASNFTRNTRQSLGEAIQRRVLGEFNKREYHDEVRRIFGPQRVANAAATEVTRGVSASGEEAVRRFELDGRILTATWHTELDSKVCKICRPLHNTAREVWSMDYPIGPPAHPSCRCYLNYREE